MADVGDSEAVGQPILYREEAAAHGEAGVLAGANRHVRREIDLVSGEFHRFSPFLCSFFGPGAIGCGDGAGVRTRSEEHTSELQSLMRISYAVFCLTKKNKTTHDKYYI